MCMDIRLFAQRSRKRFGRTVSACVVGAMTVLSFSCGESGKPAARAADVTSSASAPSGQTSSSGLVAKSEGVQIGRPGIARASGEGGATTTAQVDPFDVNVAFKTGRPIAMRFAWPAGCRVAVKAEIFGSSGVSSIRSFTVVTERVGKSSALRARLVIS
jgi:hypothetical protein